jgi:hypothetical protein
MKNARLSLACTFIFLAAAGVSSAGTTSPGEDVPARLEGVIHSERGEPLVGAIVSVFGANLAGGGLITLSDENGYFRISDLPPGYYTLRAYLSGFLPSRSSRIEVSDHDGVIEQVSMRLSRLDPPENTQTPFALEDDSHNAAVTEEEKRRITELKWLLRHGKRNVLHDRGLEAFENEGEERVAQNLSVGPEADLNGEFGVMGTASEEGLLSFPGAGAGLDARLAYARLDIPTGPTHRWEVSAQLMESVMSSWAGRAEFISDGLLGNRTSAGVSYGNHLYGDLGEFRPPEAGLSRGPEVERSREWFGSVFGSHRIKMGPAEIDAGMTYYYYSYLDQSSYAAPNVQVSWSPGEAGNTVLRGNFGYRVRAPGGEYLDLLARMVSADFIGTADNVQRGLSAEKTMCSQVALQQRVGDEAILEVRLFQEEAVAQLVKAYMKDQPQTQIGPGHYIVWNQGDYRTRGVGLAVSRRFGSVASSVGYRYGLARALSPEVANGFAGGSDKEIHDLMTSLETEIDRTQTRLLAVYRLMSHPSFLPGDVEEGEYTLDSRFNVQVYQMLPFVGWEKTQWELMLAVRNLFYEDLGNVTFLDELAIIDSPRRLLGGVLVRF